MSDPAFVLILAALLIGMCYAGDETMTFRFRPWVWYSSPSTTGKREERSNSNVYASDVGTYSRKGRSRRRGCDALDRFSCHRASSQFYP